MLGVKLLFVTDIEVSFFDIKIIRKLETLLTLNAGQCVFYASCVLDTRGLKKKIGFEFFFVQNLKCQPDQNDQ